MNPETVALFEQHFREIGQQIQTLRQDIQALRKETSTEVRTAQVAIKSLEGEMRHAQVRSISQHPLARFEPVVQIEERLAQLESRMSVLEAQNPGGEAHP